MGLQISLMSKYRNLGLTCLDAYLQFTYIKNNGIVDTPMNRPDDPKLQFHNLNSTLWSSKLTISLFQFS